MEPKQKIKNRRSAARRSLQDVVRRIPYNRELGYYKVWLTPGCELAKLYGMTLITARMIERTQKNGTHRFLDLPRPGHGVEAIELVCADAPNDSR